MITVTTPLEMLQSELTRLERDLERSKELFEVNKITWETHQTHAKNLNRWILLYRTAVTKLLE